MEDDLASAFFQALELDGDACIEFALDHSWERSTDRVLAAQVPIDWDRSAPQASKGPKAMAPVAKSGFL